VALNLEELKQWIGQRESDVDYVTIPAVHRLAATLDRDDPMPRNGDPLPIGWHFILFPRVVRQSQLGTDGHPQRGDFLPPVPLPRRMFASKRTTMIDDLRVGDEVRRESIIKDVTVKEGRSGTMVFVTVQTDFLSPRGMAIVEEQDLVYRGEPDRNAPRPAPQSAPGNAVWSKTIVPDPVLLFRYSALTFNGHRIHYDHPYVTNSEGYPERVVNGSLTTLLALELARTHAAAPLKFMSSRAVRPLFVNRPFTVCGEPGPDGKSVKLWAIDDQNALAMSVTADLR
jgi:3-methylfumaryl-CoA hydratase